MMHRSLTSVGLAALLAILFAAAPIAGQAPAAAAKANGAAAKAYVHAKTPDASRICRAMDGFDVISRSSARRM